jgi:MFS family permease
MGGNSAIFNRWTSVVLAGGIIMGLSLGIRQAQGLFMLPITIDLGWTREFLGFSFAVQNLVWGLVQPLTGIIADRFDSARVIVFGIVIYALGLVAMAYSQGALEFSLSTGVLVGAGLAGTAFAVIYGAVGKIVPPEHRPWAIGAVGAIGGLVQFLVVPLIQLLLDQYAWSPTLVILGVAFLVMLPLSALLRTSGVPIAADAGETSIRKAIGGAFRNGAFWWLNLGFMACGFQLAFIAGHLPSYLIDQGLPSYVGGAAIALISLANVFGTFAFGYLGGSRFRRKYLLSFIYFARSVSIALFLLLPLSPITVYGFAIAMGLLWLGTVPLTSGLIGQIFGTKYVTTLFGFVFFGHQIGAFLGIWLAGAVFDATKSYSQIWWLAIALGAIAGLLHLPVRDKPLFGGPMLKAVTQ